MNCIFVSDLHGNVKRYNKLFDIIEKEKPDAVFFGGDILPNQFSINEEVDRFLDKQIFSKITDVEKKLGKKIRFFIIMGNDDPRVFEKYLIDADEKGIIDYVNEKTVPFEGFFVTGYSYVTPTPFQLKDWERYDVSRYVDVGSISPEEGIRSIDVNKDVVRYSTIADDLKKLGKNAPVDKTIFLFHSPPYDSGLDRAALDGKSVEHAPLDVHIGSIAIQRFIEKNHPMLTLHGHVHESFDLTGIWKEKNGNVFSYSAANNNGNLVIVRFNTNDLKNATREEIKV